MTRDHRPTLPGIAATACRRRARWLGVVTPALISLLAAAALVASPVAAGSTGAPAWISASTRPAAGLDGSSYDAVIEAVRQTVLAAQVSGAVVHLAVKPGDRVSAGQVLLRIDARAAEQGAAASEAQLRAARASQEVATQEFERQQKLHAAQFISTAALDRARAEFRAAQANASAQAAQAEAARTQSGFYTLRAPYAGVVSEVPVSLGDMATPGRPLLTVYDPSALRVSASVPQTVASRFQAGRIDATAIKAEVPGAGPGLLTPRAVQWLPAADAATHTVTLRAELPAATPALSPGQFARIWLQMPDAAPATPAMPARAGAAEAPATGAPAAAATPRSVWVPTQAVVRRAELTGLYVLDAQGRPLLRQVRLGRVSGDQVEVLTGLTTGERVLANAETAARVGGSSR
jgi:RND family efflux transporter MFP subunit